MVKIHYATVQCDQCKKAFDILFPYPLQLKAEGLKAGNKVEVSNVNCPCCRATFSGTVEI